MYHIEKSVSKSKERKVIELCQQYGLGKRNFPKAQLHKADLEANSLSNVNLREADLSYANLKNVDLSVADLRDSSLIRVELSGANLTGACLNKACLTAANLDQVDLRYANLTGTYIIGVDLSRANLNGAFYDEDTQFPPNFDPINAGMQQNYTLEQLIAHFNHICQCSNRYLGLIMTTKYLHSSRPEFAWLNNFEINKFNQITFAGIVTDSLSYNQLRWFQKWMQSFIQLCSQIITNFPQLI